MIRETVTALLACLVSFVLCAVAYPAVVWGLAQLAFPHQAEGSLIYDRDRTVIGSELIAQPFASDRYFQPRPSAVDYKADATGGSNLGHQEPRPAQENRRAGRGAQGHPGTSRAGGSGHRFGFGSRPRHQPGSRGVPGSSRCRRSPDFRSSGPRAADPGDRSLRRDHRRASSRQRPEAQPGSRRGCTPRREPRSIRKCPSPNRPARLPSNSST